MENQKEVFSTETETTKTYNQEDVDNITNKVRANLQSKYEELENKYNQLNLQLKQRDLQDMFVKNHGNPKAFNDFFVSNKDILDLEQDKWNEKFQEIKTNKPYFFNKSFENEDRLVGLDEDEITKQTFNEKDKGVGFIPGTFIPK